MEIAIMQPYFLPYIGYFQLLDAVDEFVLYDNIKFTKKGWINRNRILAPNGEDEMFSISLKKDSDQCFINERYISSEFEVDKLLRKIENYYRKAPFFNDAMPIIESIFKAEAENLFDYIYNSIRVLCNHFDIKTPIVLSSQLSFDHNDFRAQDKVMEICLNRNANTYLNPVGGMDLYDKPAFAEKGINLEFHKTRAITYPQFGAAFQPYLSILDVMMFNDTQTIKSYLSAYDRL